MAAGATPQKPAFGKRENAFIVLRFRSNRCFQRHQP
jgi:hypothetical protein